MITLKITVYLTTGKKINFNTIFKNETFNEEFLNNLNEIIKYETKNLIEDYSKVIYTKTEITNE